MVKLAKGGGERTTNISKYNLDRIATGFRIEDENSDKLF